MAFVRRIGRFSDRKEAIMGAEALAVKTEGVVAARTLLGTFPAPVSGWCLEALLGRFTELSGGSGTAALTWGAGLVLEAQRQGRAAAWIGGSGSMFYPPDFAASGIDLEALPVVRVADAAQGARAADTLVRSGGFALVVLDVGRGADLPIAVQTRLAGLAKKHHTALVVLTRKSRRESPHGSLVSLRGETRKERIDHNSFRCEVIAVKDKRRAPGWTHVDLCHGPDGLC